MLVTKVFTRTSNRADELSEEITKWLRFKTFVSQSSSSTIDDERIYITVVVVAEDKLTRL